MHHQSSPHGASRAGSGRRANWPAALLLLSALALSVPASAQQEPLEEARFLNQQAVQFYYQGRYGDAVLLIERALALREKALGPEHPDVATSLGNLAALYLAQGRAEAALGPAQRALAIREKLRGSEHLDVSLSLSNLAEIQHALGRYDDAIALGRRALAIREKLLGPEHPDVAASLNNLAGLYESQGRYAEAEPMQKRALAIRERALGPDDPAVSESHNNLGSLYENLGRYAEAETHYRLSLAIIEKALGPEHPRASQPANNLASLFERIGRLDEAGRLYARALAINEKTHGVDHPASASVLSNLAGIYVKQRRYDEAERLDLRALSLREKLLGPEHPDVALSLNNLATLYDAQKRYAEAEKLLRRSLAIKEKALGPSHPDVGVALNNLGAATKSLGHDQEAETLYRRALAIREQALGSEHPSVATSLDNLALLYRAQGRLAEAYDTARKSVAILQKRALADVARDGAAADGGGRDSERRYNRASFLAFLSIAALQAAKSPEQRDTIAAESFVAAQLAQHSSADRALAQASLRFASATDALAAIVRALQDATGRRTGLDTALVSAVSEPPERRAPKREQAMRDELAALDRTIGETGDRLRRDFPAFAELSNPQPLALQAAQAQLAADEALVAFVVAESATYRFILRRDRAQFLGIAVRGEAIDRQVRALRFNLDLGGIESLAELRPYDAAAAYALYKTLFADAGPMLAGASRLLIVPDGPLGGLPFSVLPTREPAASPGFASYRRMDWLVRDFAITVLPSAGSLRALRGFAARAPAPREPFLGFGDPDLGERPGDARGGAKARGAKLRLASRGAVADVAAIRELPELPDTAEELRKIALALHADPAASTYLRRAATERRVKSTDLARYRVLTFATHGLMAGDFADYGEPALVLTPPDMGDETDDGLLSASEVAQLKLDADWVILSACNTAAPDGAPGAEGLSGLARALFYAGSRALLVSHWPVLSDASVRLTTGAIEALAKDPSLGRAGALRRSMLALLDDPAVPEAYAHPAIWAPFSLVGEGGAGR